MCARRGGVRKRYTSRCTPVFWYYVATHVSNRVQRYEKYFIYANFTLQNRPFCQFLLHFRQFVTGYGGGVTGYGLWGRGQKNRLAGQVDSFDYRTRGALEGGSNIAGLITTVDINVGRDTVAATEDSERSDGYRTYFRMYILTFHNRNCLLVNQKSSRKI